VALKKMKKIVLHLIGGANIATILVMIVVGYSGKVSPISHPILSTLSMAFPFILAINLLFLVFWLLVKWRYAIIPIVGLLLCYQPVRNYCPININGGVPDDAIKVMSFNVWMYAMHRSYKDAIKIPEYIVATDPDIVCLQEADCPPAILAGVDDVMLPHYAYRDSVFSRKTGDRLVLYSKFPIKKKDRIYFDKNYRAAAIFHVDINGEEVLVMNHHFQASGLTSEDREQFKNMIDGDMRRDVAKTESKELYNKLASAARHRAPQVKRLTKYFKDHSDKPIIFCADLNDTPLSYAHQQIGKYLTDCFVESGNGFGFSYNRGGMYVRIDHIFCSEHFTPCKCVVDKKIDISDHYPVVCYLKMDRKP